jgi:hypothetical protein
MHAAANAFMSEVEPSKVGRREQQGGARVNLGAIFFFRPRQGAIVSPQAGFDMRDGHARRERSPRRAECAGRIALYDQQLGRLGKERGKRRFDLPHVRVRVLLAGAGEIDPRIAVEPVLGRIERVVLPGEDQARVQAARGQRGGDGCQLDRFRPGANDQPYVPAIQPSP